MLLPENVSPTAFENQLLPFYDKYNKKNNALEQKYVLQPLSELHSGLCNNYSNRQVPDKNLLILGVIGLFLIIVAAINFINLSVVQATKRFKEIGIKKILGESKRQSSMQFLIESIAITLIAAFIGLFIAHFLFIYLESVIGYRLNLNLLMNPSTFIYLISLALIIGILSGLYPSTIIAGMSPNVALKSSLAGKNSSISLSLRSTLVIIQFCISLVLIIGTLVMNQQLNFFMNKDLGFNKEAILLVTLPNSNSEKRQLLKEKLKKHPEFEMVSYGTRSPLADWRVNSVINHPSIEKNEHFANLKTADVDYLNLFELKLIAGKNYSQVKNNGEVVVNRQLSKLLGFIDPQKAIGERFKFGNNGSEFIIVAVVENFHAQSLHKSMENVIFSNLSFNINEMAIKMNPNVLSLNAYQESIKKVEKEWDEIFPDDIMNYRFFDDKIASLYQEEENTAKLIQLFAMIAILIGSLGLFGLISYIINQKTKEIGIRKVNGATILEIISLLNWSFVKWILIAFVVAVPVSYYLMNRWLENFAYRIDLGWWVFAVSGCIALAISLLTVSWQSFTAARRNPVEALRHE